MNSQHSHSDHRYLWFQRQSRLYALPMEHLQEVLPAPDLRTLPASEPALAGLMSLRDYVFPVFDPQSFASSPDETADAARIVIALSIRGRVACGLLAEKFGKVISLPALLPVTLQVRLAPVFAGEFSTTNSKENGLVFNILELARAMGLEQDNHETEKPALAA
jgi:hypothetical protein